MGQYKVPQNVEAEDKILGPLSLRQFIYVIIGLAYGALMFAIFRQFIAGFIILGLPPALFMLILGVGRRDDQTFESYFFAVIQYWITPRIRFWEKEPIFEVFKIEIPVPKPEEIRRDPREVRGQLEKLASIVDTRGWAIKEPEVQESSEVATLDLSDRLGGEAFGASAPTYEPSGVEAADDILDADNNPDARNLNALIENSAKSVREEALAMMSKRVSKKVARVPESAPPRPGVRTQPQPKTAAAHLHSSPAGLPQDSIPVSAHSASSGQASSSGMTAPVSGDILKLATEGGDLSIAALAAQAAQSVRHNQELLEGQAVNIRNANSPAA